MNKPKTYTMEVRERRKEQCMNLRNLPEGYCPVCQDDRDQCQFNSEWWKNDRLRSKD